MATKKQRRRREKEKRHEYEIVYVDEDGNELAPDAVGARAPAKEPPARRASGSRQTRSSRSRGREPQPPSWQRSIKRGAIFTPAFAVVLLLMNRKHGSIAGILIAAAFLIVVFVPFSYFLDSLVWRSHQKRLSGTTGKR